MRPVLWFVLLFALAVLAASVLGSNDGLVSIYWAPWRVDLSLNLVILSLAVAFVLGYAVLRAVSVLRTLPSRAAAWRAARHEQQAQAALREGWAELLSGRYTRAHRAAEQALKAQSGVPVNSVGTDGGDAKATRFGADATFTVLARLLAAASMHRLQDRERRDEHLQQALAAGQGRPASEVADGVAAARLMAAEWALEDRDAQAALQHLGELAPGVARRAQALRLRLQATRMAHEPLEALRTARMLAKHQAFSKMVALSLLRSLANESLSGARDPDQLEAVWQQLEATERQEPFVAAHAARAMAGFGEAATARRWIQPLWDRWDRLTTDERATLCEALADAADALEPDWLQRIEKALAMDPRDPHVVYVAARAFEQSQLWGKARNHLEQAASSLGLPASRRRDAWRRLAALAERDGATDQAQQAYRQAAQLD